MVNIGALTNKITALSYRSWDLYNVNFRTTTDEYFIGKTSNKILRVLKKHSHQKNYFWITDIERFKYDSLTHQRITKLNFKTKKNIFFIHPFFRRTAIFGSNLNKSIFSIINKHIDITTKANKIKLMDIYSSFKPNSLIFSDIVIKEDQNIIFLIDYSVLTLVLNL
jgi:NADH dehydrogenase/NADH:ubiquinone oxidoreductase subunit G